MPATSLGNAGIQRVLLGEPRGDGSPVLLGVTVIQAGKTSPMIKHDSAEVAYVLSGTGSMVTDTASFPFATGNAILIGEHCWHAIRAGEEQVQMLYVFPGASPPPTTRLDEEP